MASPTEKRQMQAEQAIHKQTKGQTSSSERKGRRYKEKGRQAQERLES
jgi:hypothetical protein